jgi:phospho-N-acetylmuramoyl-pentapeptide-transferase
MLYHLSEWTDWYSPLRVFQYVTFRALGAAGTAFVLSLLLGPPLIAALRRFKLGQPDRMTEAERVQAMHAGKRGTPTMGGVMIILATLVASALWAIPSNGFVWMVLATMVYMGAIGFWDDYLKVRRIRPKGLSARVRMAWETLWVVALVFLLWQRDETRPLANDIMVPFLKTPLFSGISMGAAIVYLFFVLVGSTNAVNLTDGLDGLAIGCTNAVAAAYLVMAYVAGHAVFAQYLQVPYIPGASELTIVMAALLGAGMGFLWYNCHPARLFMGDTGSLALGGAIAATAILIQQEIVLILVGGVFVMEAVSVMLQVGWFKLSGGKRLFLCAPLHHHCEIVGKERARREGRDQEVVETMVTIRFWILSMLFALIGLATLKIR